MSEIDFYSSSNIEISIVVPAYNEELRLPTMLADTITVRKSVEQINLQNPTASIFFVDAINLNR